VKVSVSGSDISYDALCSTPDNHLRHQLLPEGADPPVVPSIDYSQRDPKEEQVVLDESISTQADHIHMLKGIFDEQR